MGQEPFCSGESVVKRRLVLLGCAGLALVAVSAFMYSNPKTEAAVAETVVSVPEPLISTAVLKFRSWSMDVPRRGVCAGAARATLKAIAGAEYRSQDSHPLPFAWQSLCQSMV